MYADFALAIRRWRRISRILAPHRLEWLVGIDALVVNAQRRLVGIFRDCAVDMAFHQFRDSDIFFLRAAFEKVAIDKIVDRLLFRLVKGISGLK